MISVYKVTNVSLIEAPMLKQRFCKCPERVVNTKIILHETAFPMAELSRAWSPCSRAPWVRKFGYLCISDILVVTKLSVCFSVHMSTPSCWQMWNVTLSILFKVGPAGPSCSKDGSATHQINLHPLDSAIGFPNTYPLDSDFSGG